MRNHIASLTLLLLALTSGASALAEEQIISNKSVAEIVRLIAGNLRDNYPFPEVSALYVKTLERNLKSERYHGLKDCELAARITEDLGASHRDLHLRIMCDAEFRSVNQHFESDSESDYAANGIQLVELDMPIAYIRSAGPWVLSEDAFNLAANAMGMVAHAKYVIIDVRDNPGGHGEIGDFIASYFFPVGEANFLVNGYYLDSSKDRQEYTSPFVPGRRLPDAELYILVNARTGSAAEGFAFGLQHLKRATIVGQKTAGAGIASEFRPLKEGLVMLLPVKMIVAPHTKVGFDGIGVIPDIVTAPGDERAAVMKKINDELQEDAKRSHPEVVPASTATLATVAPAIKSDPAKSENPNLDHCKKVEIDEKNNKLLLTNNCGEKIVVQYETSKRPYTVYEMYLDPGEAMRAEYVADAEKPSWWIVATCPSGYLSTVPVDATNREAIIGSRYTCKKK